MEKEKVKYYKAIWYTQPKNSFKVIEYNDANVESLTSTIYSFIDKESSGIFAVRASKKDAINALKKRITEKINKSIDNIKELMNIYELINDEL